MIDYDKLEKSLKHLEAQFENYKHSKERPELSDLDREAIGESVIQRFETCYDTLWKTLKRYLAEELGLPDTPNSPRGVFRLAGQNSLLTATVEQWFKYVDARIATSHDYSGEKAQECRAIMYDFLHDAIDLYRTMTGKARG